MHDRSRSLFERSLELIPGGVNSPVRAFKAVGGSPHFIARASGARITDIDGRPIPAAYRQEIGGIRLYELDPDVRCIVPTQL